MTIEFRCTQCEKLLRTPEGTAGKKAKCPQCGTLLTIPGEGEHAEVEAMQADAGLGYAAPPLPPLSSSSNPYQSPMSTEMHARPVHDGSIRRGFEPTKIDLGDVMNSAWKIYKANLWRCVGMVALLLVLNYGLVFVMSMALYLLKAQNEAGPRFAVQFFNMAVQWFFTLGAMNYMLKMAKGDETSVSEMFNAGSYYLPGIAIYILFAIATGIGFVLLIIPGIYVMLLLSQSFYILLDKNPGIIQSMQMSAQATKGNKLTLIALGLVGGSIALIGILALLVGYFFAVAYVFLLFAVAYLKMTGQSTADEVLGLA